MLPRLIESRLNDKAREECAAGTAAGSTHVEAPFTRLYGQIHLK